MAKEVVFRANFADSFQKKQIPPCDISGLIENSKRRFMCNDYIRFQRDSGFLMVIANTKEPYTIYGDTSIL